MMDAVSLTPVYRRARHAGPSASYQNPRVLGKCSNFWRQTRGDFAAVAGSFCSVTVLSICLGRLGRHGDHGRSRLPRGFWTWPWVSDTAKEIKELLLAAKGEELEPSSRRKVEEGIDFLAAARVPCPAELLGDSSSPSEGLWRSVFIQGKIPKWEENARLLKPLVRNKAGQAYDAKQGRVTNYGEILGPLVHFVAEGSFTAKDGTGQCPKEFDVEIEQGGLVLFGVPLLSSAISGPGLVRVLYIDEDIRIFESPTESPDRWEEEGLRVIQLVKLMEIGTEVFVKGKGRGILALNNEDGTWNVEFYDDGAEGDFYEEDLMPLEDLVRRWSPAGARVVPAPWTSPRPEGWTRFVCFSDTHGLHQLIPKDHMPPADVLLHAGDFTNTGELEQIEFFNEWLEAYPAEQKLVIAGNHDITLQEDPGRFCLKNGSDLPPNPLVSPGLLMMGIVHTLGGFLASNGAIETSCVADATPAGPKRAVAVGRFLTVVGAALVLGPFLGGILLENFGGRSPFAFAAVLGFIALLAMTGFVPEYLPPSRRSQSSSTTKAPVLAAFQLLVQNPALRWYTAASGLFSLGMAVYGTVNVLWLKEAFGWNGQDVGHFLSAVGAAVIISQVVFLPVLLRIAKGREPWVVQGAIVLHAIKFVGYAWAPRGPWAYVVLAISSPTFCAAPILSSLCTRHVPSTQQGLWSGSASALSTAANVVGALIGSRLLAIALEGHLPLGSPLYAGTVFHLLAALCVGCGCRVAGEKKVDEVTEGFPDPICGA